MDRLLMAERGLDDLIALNEQLATLDEAGVRLDLGVSAGRVRALVTRIGRELADSVGRGESLEASLKSDGVSATPEYQWLATAWLSGAELDTLLDSCCPSTPLETERHRLTAGLIYPVLVTLLACVGLAAMVTLVLPHIEAAYADLDEPVGTGVAGLQVVRGAIPALAIAVPVALAFGVYSVLNAKTPTLTSKSREIGAPARARYARASHIAGDLVGTGMPPEEALQQAGLAARSEPQRQLPALLDWASSSVAERSTATNDLHAIGRLYDGMAKRGAQRYAVLTPALACVVIAGGATFAYALALFLPVIEMLWTLAH